MASSNLSLIEVLSGWDGFQTSLVSAVSPLSADELRFRLPHHERSVGQIAAHIAFGRIDWFSRMDASGAKELMKLAEPVWKPSEGAKPSVTESANEVVKWLELSWEMVENCLKIWTVDNLKETYLLQYDKLYRVPRQWTIFRIMAHDIYHSGQLTILLAEQGIEPDQLYHNGGHIIEVPAAE